MLGVRGVTFTEAGGKDGATWFEEYKQFSPGETGSYAAQGAFFDTVIMSALAIYATGVDEPTPEQVNAAVMAIQDPQGEVVGCRDLKRAKAILDAGGKINYDGVQNTHNFDIKHSVRSEFFKWRVEKVDGQIMYVVIP